MISMRKVPKLLYFGIVLVCIYTTSNISLYLAEHFIEQDTALVINKRETKWKLVTPIDKRLVKFIGPGEGGTAVNLDKSLLSTEQKDIFDSGYQKHGFNVFASNLISLDRTLKDITRSEECSRKTYPSDLPLVSVIIPFRNEALSVLLRTVHSIINTTPQQNLVDIILVDDGSTDDDVKSVLEVHVKGMTKVKILRLSSSVGLMGARQKGIENATSDIIVVMDSHMEVTAGWFEPIATEMKMDPKALLTGQVGVIDSDTFQFQSFPLDKVPENSLDYQTFDFYLYQTGAFLKEEYLKTRKMKSDPFYIPAIQGNFFMMNRTIFLKLGGFDLGMKLWGAEQFELSFKVWMCGGSIKCVPCSLAGHLYREIIWKRPKTENKHSNEYRLAAVWMDQYRNDVFEMLGNYSLEYGDVEERRKIRRTNKCKSFQYYLDKVKTFAHIYIPRGRKAKGIIQNAATEACLDGPLHYGSHIAIITYWCHYKGYNQYWELSAKDQLRHSYVCVRRNMTNHAVTERCKEHDLDEQTWRYNQNDEIVEQSSGLCLTANTVNTPVHLEACKGMRNQKWFWTRLERDD